MLDEEGLVEELGLVEVVGFSDEGGEGFGAAEPAADADALGEVGVAHRLHGLADGLLGAVEFAADGGPVVLAAGGVEDDLGVFDDGVADGEGVGEVEHLAADAFDLLAVLGLDGDEALRDDGPELEGEAGAVGGAAALDLAELGAPVRLAELVEDGEDLGGDGDDDVIDHGPGEVFEIEVLGA